MKQEHGTAWVMRVPELEVERHRLGRSEHVESLDGSAFAGPLLAHRTRVRSYRLHMPATNTQSAPSGVARRESYSRKLMHKPTLHMVD